MHCKNQKAFFEYNLYTKNRPDIMSGLSIMQYCLFKTISRLTVRQQLVNRNDFFFIVRSACFTYSMWHSNAPHLLHFTNVGADIFQFALRRSLLPLEDLFFGQIDMVTPPLVITSFVTFGIYYLCSIQYFNILLIKVTEDILNSRHPRVKALLVTITCVIV